MSVTLSPHSGAQCTMQRRTGGLPRSEKVAPGDLRQNFVHAHAVALSAIATAGADLAATRPHPVASKATQAGNG